MTVPRIDSNDEPWLRDALGALLVDEPPLDPSTVVADVRRGEVALAVVKRRRTATYAIAAVLLAVAVPVGLLLRAGPSTSTPPASSITSAPRVEGVSQQWLDSISPAVLGAVTWVVDWPASTVSGTAATGMSLDLTLVPVSITSGHPPVITLPTPPYPETARLRLAFLPTGAVPGPALAACPQAQCPRDTPDRKFPEWLDVVATAATSTRFPSGTTILDRAYDTGRLVELVSSPSVDTYSHTVVRGTAVLGYAWAASVLDAIGDPAAAPSASPSPSASGPVPSIDAALVDTGWAVSSSRPTRSLDTLSVFGTEYSAYLITPVKNPGAMSAHVFVSLQPHGPTKGGYLAQCTTATCPQDRTGRQVDTGDPQSSFVEDSVTAGAGVAPGQGSLILDRTYGSGTLAEIVVTTPGTSPGSSPVASTDSSALALEQAERILDLLGDPAAPGGATPIVTPTPTATLPLMRQTAAQTAYAIAHPCRASDLSASLSTDGATGTLLSYYLFRNSSSRPCGLRGYPTLAGVRGAALPFTVAYGVAQAGPNPTHPVQALLLDPGADATSLVTKYRCDVGERGAVAALVATVPGDSTPITLPDSRQPICVGDATASGNQIQVSAFYSVPG